MVLTSVGGAVPARLGWLQTMLPPLFLWQREGFREHAVALSRLMGEVVGGWLAVRSLHKEIGYGQQ